MRVISVRAAMIGSVAAAALFTTPAAAQENPATSTAIANNAQTQDEAATGTDEEIVVTSRRREERLINVPIAVTAYSGEQLNRQGALDITDLAETTPNVTLEASRGTNSTLTAFIRGVGQQDPVAGFEQGVGIYLDDVYLNRPQAAVLDIYDVERIEVLRGPQGTLYGRNTVGGAVKYVTRRIPADGPHFDMRTNLGTYRQADLIVSASTPVTSGLLVGVAAARLSNHGFGKNLTTGLRNYNKDVIATRGTVELVPSTTAFLRVSGDYTWDDSNPRGGHRLIPSMLTHTPMLSDVYDTQGALNDPRQKVKGGGVSIHGEAGLTDTLKVRSITAWRNDKSASPIDFDALPAVDLDVPAIYNNRQFSQELQLVYQSSRLNGIVGAYYLNANALTAFDVRIFTTFPGLAAFTSSEIGTKTTAVFGDFSYDFTDQFSLSLGGRYTWDKRDGDIFRQNYLGGGAPLFGGLGIPFGTPATDFHGSRKFNKFTPRASLSFKPNRDNNLYISFSQGFKGGGFDPRGVGVNAPDLNNDGKLEQDEVAQFIGFAPETVNSYEAGYKASLFGRRLSLATAVFRADYKDVQIPGSIPCVVNGIATFCGVTANAGKARFQGAEVEASGTVARDLVSANDRLNFAGTLGYIDAKYLRYDTFIAGKGTVEVSQYRHVQNTPKWSLSGTVDYTTPVSGGTLNLNSTVSYKSKSYQFEIANPYFDQKGYALLDGNITWRSGDGRYELGLHGKNLLNKRYKTSGYTFMVADPVTGVLLRDGNGNLISGTGKEGTLTAFYGNPRQVFLSAAVHF